MNYYSDKQIKEIKEKTKKQKIIIIIMMIFAVFVDAILITNANLSNKNLYKIISIIVTTLVVWYYILSYSLVIRNAKFQIIHVNSMLTLEKEIIIGKVIEASNSSLRSFDIETKEIVIEDENKIKHILYLENNITSDTINEGDSVRVYVVDKYIVFKEDL